MSTKTKTKSRPNIYAECDGELFIKTKYCGIDPLVRLIDGLPICFFGKGKHSPAFIRVNVAIEWHQKEIEATKGAHKREFLDALVSARERLLKPTQPEPEPISP